jgi:uncharacterized protein (DUF1778 family)
MVGQVRKHNAAVYKVERLEARISKQEKDLFAKAAALQGRSLTEFVVSSLHDIAIRVIESNRVIKLTERDSKIFANALLNPPEPNKNLKAAAKRYFELVER